VRKVLRGRGKNGDQTSSAQRADRAQKLKAHSTLRAQKAHRSRRPNCAKSASTMHYVQHYEQLIHCQDGNYFLERPVVLQDPLHATVNVIMLSVGDVLGSLYAISNPVDSQPSRCLSRRWHATAW